MLTELNGNIILQELTAIAMARATDYMSVCDGGLEIRSTNELTPEQAAAIASIERSTGGLKVKFYDKLKALELLGKYLGLFETRVRRSGEQFAPGYPGVDPRGGGYP